MKKRTTVTFALLDIEGDGFHLVADVSLNHKPARMLIDTGASRTVFDKNRIQNFIPESAPTLTDKTSVGLGTDTMESHIEMLQEFEIGKLKIREMQIILLDLVHVNQSYQKIGLPAIDGVIGSDLLTQHKAVIDYSKKKLTLSY